jgi:large subunit ribosomal protein LX
LGKVYRVTGSFQMGDRQAHFSTNFEVASAERAREKAYSDFGSRHHVKRRQIKIDKIEEVKEHDPAPAPKGGE